MRAQKLFERTCHEATKGQWLWTAPNPRVGALALKDGHVVGYGFHQVWGGPHAEEQALIDCGAMSASGEISVGHADEMVVSLEPCSHTGEDKKRPPCTQLLLDAGIRKVTMGATDPHPKHSGRAVELLIAAGVKVEIMEAGQADFEALNPAFLRSLEHTDRPWVLLKWAASMEGKTATESGASQWITGPESRSEVHRLRASVDAVLCGPRTFLRDAPALTAREGQHLDEQQPLRVLLAPRSEPSPESPLFATESPCLVVTHPDWCKVWTQQLSSLGHVQVVEGPVHEDGRFSLEEVLQLLHRDWKVRRLLIEGGAQLQGGLLDAGCVDAIVKYEAPLLLGGTFGSLLGTGVPTPAEAVELQMEERAELGEDLRRAFLLR